MKRQPRRQEVLSRASDDIVSTRDLRDLFTPRRASQYLHKLHRAGLLDRVGGDGTKESPFVYRTVGPGTPRRATLAPFDATGLEWLCRWA